MNVKNELHRSLKCGWSFQTGFFDPYNFTKAPCWGTFLHHESIYFLLGWTKLVHNPLFGYRLVQTAISTLKSVQQGLLQRRSSHCGETRWLFLIPIMAPMHYWLGSFQMAPKRFNSDWQHLTEFHFPWKSVRVVRWSGLKGRISAGDYREEAIVEVKGDFVSYARSLYVFTAFEVHHSCQVCLWPAASVTLTRVKVRKVYAHFPLLCVYTV